jgi:hypothetical protein
MRLRSIISLLTSSLVILTSYLASACQCPTTRLSMEECNKYDLVFKGRIDSLSSCMDKKGHAFFKISELYKGLATERFEVLIDCEGECAQVLNVGEEWIVYANYKQATNAKLDWCSRSRRFIKNEKEDFYAVNNGATYDQETEFLRTNLGLHKPLKPIENQRIGEPNQLPTQKEFIVYLLLSIVGLVVFYYLFNKFFK